MPIKTVKESEFEHNATNSRFMAKRRSEFLTVYWHTVTYKILYRATQSYKVKIKPSAHKIFQNPR